MRTARPTLLSIAAAALVLSACGSSGSSSPTTNPGTTPAIAGGDNDATATATTTPAAASETDEAGSVEPTPVTTLAPTTPTSTVPPELLVDVPAAGPLTTEQLRAAAFQVSEPTSDIVETLGLLAPMPRIGTPGESMISGFSIGTRPLTDVDTGETIATIVESTVTLLTAGSRADLDTFYLTNLAANGYVEIGSDQRDDNGTTMVTRWFDDPNRPAVVAFERRLGVTTSEAGIEGLRRVTIQYTDDVNAIDLSRLGSWASTFPGLDGLEFSSGDVSVSAFGPNQVTITATANALDAAIARSKVEQALPGDGWSVTGDSDISVTATNSTVTSGGVPVSAVVYFEPFELRNDRVQVQLTLPIPAPNSARLDPGAPADPAYTPDTSPTPDVVVTDVNTEALTIEEITTLATGLIGSNPDPIGALAPLTPTITGLPSPDDGALVGFDIAVRPLSGQPGIYTSNTVTVHTAAAFDDVVTFYNTAMAAAGYTQTGDADGTNARSFTYPVPNASNDIERIEITIADRSSVREITVRVRLVVDDLTAQRLGTWATALTDTFTVTDATVAIIPGDSTVRLTANTDNLDDIAATIAAIEATLPADGFEFVDADDDIVRYLYDGQSGTVIFTDNTVTLAAAVTLNITPTAST